MSRSFAASIASGYAAIAVQAITGVLLVPYLISAHGVGLHGFGEIATIQALAAMLSVVLDGHRQEAARRIALSMTAQSPPCLSSLLAITGVSCVVLGSIGALLAEPLTSLVHLRSGDIAVAWRIACAAFVLEQLCYLLESQLHSARRGWLANALGAGDAVTRAVLTVSLFTLLAPSPLLFFLAALISLAVKFTFLASICWRALRDGAVFATLPQELRMLVRSLPLALNGIAPFLVFRLTVIVGNKYLGSEQAGVLSIILVTVRTYLNQAMFSAMRPILLARLAGTGWADQPVAARQSFVSRMRMYQAGVCALGIALACATPIWLPLWLGPALQQYAAYFAILLALFAAELAYGIPYYWLVANGHARRLALVNGLAGALVSGAVLIATWWHGASMVVFTVAVASYLIIYMLGVRYEFQRWFGVKSGSERTEQSGVAVIDGSAR